MLKNNKLLIDKDCPMCQAYGQCFTSIGLIEKGTLSPYQHADGKMAAQINMDRARTEIALHDTQTGKTLYGIEAMIEITSHWNRPLNSLLHWSPIFFLLKKLYKFISYNRKVIYPYQKTDNANLRDCVPEVSAKYRWMFILSVAVLTGFILNHFSLLLNTSLGLPHDWKREYLICFGQILWQSAAVWMIEKDKMLDYLGNMSAVSLAGGLLLLPLVWLNSFVALPLAVLFGGFMLVVAWMFGEHLRRCRLLGLPLMMSVSWAGYRAAVLIVILAVTYASACSECILVL